MKKYFILAIIILQATNIIAQRLPVVSHFMYDYARTNPGSLGSEDMINITLISKQEYIGMPGKPFTTYFNAEVPFKLFGANHGVGISAYNDQIGFNSDIDVKLGYAFRFTAGNGTIGIGINGGYRQAGLVDPVWDGGGVYDATIGSDDYIPQGNSKGGSFGFGAGIFYRAENVFFGVGAANIFSTPIEYEASGSAVATTVSSATEQMKPHYFLTAGYNRLLSNSAYEIKPAISIYSDGVSHAFDINTTLVYNKKIWGGVSYRTGSSVIGMVGIMILDGLRAGYAYDFQTNSMMQSSGGSHEIMLNYSFRVGVEKSPLKYKSIRYL